MDKTREGEIQFALQAVAELLSADERILAAYLLGSFGTERQRPDSDIDIAVMPRPDCRLTADELMDLAGALTAAAGRRVDVGLLSTQNLIYACQAIGDGRRIFCRDAFRADLTAATLLSLAAQLRFERREIVDAYTHR